MPRCAGWSKIIAERADGNPFFAEEIVRDLAERGALRGTRGSYRCTETSPTQRCPPRCRPSSPPASTAFAPAAKRTLNAAAVVGTRFNPELLSSAGD